MNELNKLLPGKKIIIEGIECCIAEVRIDLVRHDPLCETEKIPAVRYAKIYLELLTTNDPR